MSSISIKKLIPLCNVGILERPERILLLFLGAAIPLIMPYVIWGLAILTNLTVIQRIWYTYGQVRKAEGLDREEEERTMERQSGS